MNLRTLIGLCLLVLYIAGQKRERTSKKGCAKMLNDEHNYKDKNCEDEPPIPQEINPKNPQPATNHYNEPPNRCWRWPSQTVINTIFTGVVAGFTGLLWWTSTESNRINHDTLISTNRAWIEPSNPKIYSGLVRGEPFNYGIPYANIGKEPALNVVIQVFPRTVEPPNANASWYDRLPNPNETCGTAKPNPNGLVVYPSEPLKRGVGYPNQPLPDAEAVWKGTRILVIEGCIGYETFREAHYSAFCYHAQPIAGKPPDQWPLILCQTRNRAT